MTTTESADVPIEEITFLRELYPRVREDDAAIERYRAALDRLPPIAVARGRILVDGFLRWQAHRRAGRTEIAVEELGNLTDLEIRNESLRRNASHGRQLEISDKRRQAGELYLLGVAESELVELLSVTPTTLEKYLREAKATEKQRQKESLWDRWLNCEWDSYKAAADALSITDKTVKLWISEFSDQSEISEPPASRQRFDLWNFPMSDSESSYFGAMPPQIVENVLWLFTEPGQIVVDPFAGSGTTIDVAKRRGRRVWASDRKPSTPLLPIHEHDIVTGWPSPAPKKADLILLDPPYWKQAAGRYSDDAADLGNMALDAFLAAWASVVKTCVKHLAADGRLAFIASPTDDKDDHAVHRVVDLPLLMYDACRQAGLRVVQRIIVPYPTQAASAPQVEWARKEKKLLKLYRDLLVMTR